MKYLLTALMLLITGCQNAEPSPDGLPVVSMQIGSKAYQLEVAADDKSREKGLMERDDMPQDHGIILVYPELRNAGVSMYHTRFPLDVIFLDEGGTIVAIDTMKAYDQSFTYSHGAAKYAVEITAGDAVKDGVKVGDTLEIPNDPDKGLSHQPYAGPKLPEAALKIGSKTYNLEVAADDASREHGLMDRDKMPADHGMIFIFTEAKPQNFWMHRTRFPLDIIFADAAGKVVSIHTMKAYDETNTPSGAAAKYAIELSAGEAAADGIKVGEELKFPTQVTNQPVK